MDKVRKIDKILGQWGLRQHEKKKEQILKLKQL